MKNDPVIAFLTDLQKVDDSSASNEARIISKESPALATKPVEVKSSGKAIQNSIPDKDDVKADGLKSTDGLYSTLILSEGVVLRSWKNVANLSSQILEINGDSVLLECLVDRHLMQYAEVELPLTLFGNFNITAGSFCIIEQYERDNGIKFEINANPHLNLREDFPSVDFVKKYKDSSFFKRK